MGNLHPPEIRRCTLDTGRCVNIASHNGPPAPRKIDGIRGTADHVENILPVSNLEDVCRT